MDWIAHLDALSKQLEVIELAEDDYDEPIAEEQRPEKLLIRLLQDVCNAVRNAKSAGAPDLDAIVEKASQMIDEGINLAYGDPGFFDFMPSFAHGVGASALAKDTLENPLGQGLIDLFLPFFQNLSAQTGGPSTFDPASIPKPSSWDASLQPHPKSTPLAHFRKDVPVSVTDDTPLATIIYQARCEIREDHICLPINMSLSTKASCLAIASAGGWKNRDPVIQYYLSEELECEGIMGDHHSFDPQLSGVANHVLADEDRKLIFAADDHRVKSFSWDSPDRERPRAVHTLDSDSHDGPLALLSNGRLARAGRGEALLWNLDELETHGPRKALIGPGKFNAEDTWRENEEGDIELSTGSAPHHRVKFAEAGFTPCSWHLHAPSGRMLASNSGRQLKKYSCIAIDLEDGGKTVARYLGHGGEVESFSTSEGDANVFATAGSDGLARLYDVRHPLPVATFDAGAQREFCPDVVLTHPDGVPTLFTGGQETQQIKMWDVRARAVVYELATGNNSVVALAWDSTRSALYAATECEYMDRMGYNHDYRRARIPKRDRDGRSSPARASEAAPLGVEEEDKDEDDFEEEDSLEGDEKLWPARAFHGEDFFGYTFDAGDHRFYRYAFKADADPNSVPVYGTASLSTFGGGW